MREHKLSSTVLPRLREVTSVPTEVVEAIAHLDALSAAHAQAIRSDLQQLGIELERHARRHGPVLYLKGHSSQIHTQEHFRAHRPTTDIDLLGGDPEDLHETLVATGYQAGKPGISHELSSLHREGRVDIDVHRYFPAWSYPAGLREPLRSSIEVPRRVRTQKLMHAALLESSVPHPDVETGSIRVPGPEATALITALHAFKDYVEASFTHGERKVTLIEVLEFDELMKLPDFNMTVFDDLVFSVSGNHAVDFVKSLSSQLVGDSVHTSIGPFPRELGRGFLCDAGESLQGLVHMQAFYAGLIASRPIQGWPALTGNGVPLAAIDASAVVCRPDRYEPDATHEVSVRSTADTLILRLSAPTPCDDLHYFIHVVLGTAARYEKISLDLSNGTVLRTDNGVAESMEIHAEIGGWSATFQLSGAEYGGTAIVLHSYMFVGPVDDDWNHLYDNALLSTMIPVRLPELAGPHDGR